MHPQEFDPVLSRSSGLAMISNRSSSPIPDIHDVDSEMLHFAGTPEREVF